MHRGAVIPTAVSGIVAGQASRNQDLAEILATGKRALGNGPAVVVDADDETGERLAEDEAGKVFGRVTVSWVLALGCIDAPQPDPLWLAVKTDCIAVRNVGRGRADRLAWCGGLCGGDGDDCECEQNAFEDADNGALLWR